MSLAAFLYSIKCIFYHLSCIDDWMNSDLKAAMTQLRMYVEEQDTVPWQTLNVVVSDIVYGGRVTDIWDKRSISSILRKYFVPELLSDEFFFSEDKNYFAIANSDIFTQREFIKDLPAEDLPEVFGLRKSRCRSIAPLLS